MSWLKDHLEDFVFPYIGWEEELTPLNYFTSEEMTIIKNAWRSLKKIAKDRTILLPGRDVFIFEILARRENYPTLFMPEISRKTVKYFGSLQDFSQYYIFDTGFAGSIPRGLYNKHFKMMSHNSPKSDIHIFPRLKMSRMLALKIESTPKYWKTAFVTRKFQEDYTMTEEVSQVRSDIPEFREAARLTVGIYKDSSPRFVQTFPKQKGMFGGQWIF